MTVLGEMSAPSFDSIDLAALGPHKKDPGSVFSHYDPEQCFAKMSRSQTRKTSLTSGTYFCLRADQARIASDLLCKQKERISVCESTFFQNFNMQKPENLQEWSCGLIRESARSSTYIMLDRKWSDPIG